jgi:hypothetical protein
MALTEKDLDRYYAAKLMESFRKVFGFKTKEEFERHQTKGLKMMDSIKKETNEGKQ